MSRDPQPILIAGFMLEPFDFVVEMSPVNHKAHPAKWPVALHASGTHANVLHPAILLFRAVRVLKLPLVSFLGGSRTADDQIRTNRHNGP